MPRGNWRLIIIALVAGFAAIITSALFPKMQVIRLPDGTELKLEGVSYGGDGFTYTILAQKLYYECFNDDELLQAFGVKLGKPWRFSTNQLQALSRDIYAWFSIAGAKPEQNSRSYWEKNYRVVAVDESGDVFENQFIFPEIFPKLIGLQLSVFARNETNVGVRILSKDSSNWTEVTAFSVFNKFLANKDTWIEKHFPITNQVDGADIVFQSCRVIEDFRHRSYPPLAVALQFNLAEKDEAESQFSFVPDTGWLTDELGNRSDIPEIRKSLKSRGEIWGRYTLAKGAVWKFEGQLIRTHNFAEESLVRFVSLLDTSEALSRTNRHGIEVSARLIGGRTVEVSIPQRPLGYRVTVVSASDETGANLLTKATVGREHSWKVALERDVEMVNVVAAVQKIHPVEFYFRPSVIRSGQEASEIQAQ